MLKNKNIRCRNKPMHNCEFCRIHRILQEKKNDDKQLDKSVEILLCQYNNELSDVIKFMDDNFLYCLIGLNNSWKEIQLIYWYKIDGLWFDIRTLARTMACNLNQSDMDKPYPLYPENVFTRNRFDVAELLDFKKRLDYLKQIVPEEEFKFNIALNKFLSFKDRTLQIFRNEEDQYKLQVGIINRFSQTMRYKLINYKDQQGRYCGYWVSNNTPKSRFEKCYNKIIDASILLHNTNILIDSATYRNSVRRINRLEKEEYIL